MHNRDAWRRGSAGPQQIKGKSYKNLVEYSRPCVTCEQPFSIYVTEKIAAGHADSNSFGLKNCEMHRRNRSAGDTMANNVMKEELDGLYTRNRELFAEVQILKAKLATYELQGAMSAVAGNKMPWD